MSVLHESVKTRVPSQHVFRCCDVSELESCLSAAEVPAPKKLFQYLIKVTSVFGYNFTVNFSSD